MMFPKIINKKKSKHISNKKITEYIECSICGSQATETHEIFHDGTSFSRNMCIENEWQEKLCSACHSKVHTNREFDIKLKQKWQRKIMQQMYWDIDLWRSETHLKNYLWEE